MSREDKYEDDYRSVGNANDVCSTGRSAGTPATRPTKTNYKDHCSRWTRPVLLGTSNIDGRSKNRKQYKSYWRKRKDTRRRNKRNLEKGKDTPATIMMRECGITGQIPKYKEYEGRGTIEDEWVQRFYPNDRNGDVSTAKGLMSKRGGYHYDYVPPPEPVKNDDE
jgi:hypothetical protein